MVDSEAIFWGVQKFLSETERLFKSVYRLSDCEDKLQEQLLWLMDIGKQTMARSWDRGKKWHFSSLCTADQTCEKFFFSKSKYSMQAGLPFIRGKALGLVFTCRCMKSRQSPGMPACLLHTQANLCCLMAKHFISTSLKGGNAIWQWGSCIMLSCDSGSAQQPLFLSFLPPTSSSLCKFYFLCGKVNSPRWTNSQNVSGIESNRICITGDS